MKETAICFHNVKHYPKTTDGSGIGVCECGATIEVLHGQPVLTKKINGKEISNWHTCKVCTPQFYD